MVLGLEAISYEEQSNLSMLSLEERGPQEDLMAVIGNHRKNKVEKKEKIPPEDKTQNNEQKLKGFLIAF